VIEFSYDEEARACYIAVDCVPDDTIDRAAVAAKTRTVTMDPMINVDYHEDGSVYGIEILLPDKSDEDSS
jgi:uncharacterized protein YuzE